MNMKPYLIISGIIFGFIAIGHGLRLGFQWTVTVNGWTIPLWMSGVALVVSAILFIWAIQLARK
jgi:hypothetical protein